MSRALNASPGEPLPVVILSGGVTGLGVLRAFGRQGVPAYAYPVAADDLMRKSRWYRDLPGCRPGDELPRPSVETLEAALERSGLRAGFLCPCSDDWNRVVAEYAAVPRRGFVSVVPPLAALDVLQNKARLALLLQRLGVPMPNTRLITGPGDLAVLPPTEDTFYFLKPTDSQSFHAHFGAKGLRVGSAAEARRRLDEVVAANMSVVLQEYIPGSFSEHYFIDGYVDRQGTVKALFARRRLRIFPPDFGNSTAMVSVRAEDVAGAVASVRRVLAEVEYRGIFSAEFKRDPRDGLFKLLEINARPWWFIDFAVRSGVDVCSMAYRDARGEEVAAVEDYPIGATCVYPYYDYVATRPLIRNGHLGRLEWIRQIAAAIQPVGCWDDPVPGIVGFTLVIAGALRNRLQGRRP